MKPSAVPAFQGSVAEAFEEAKQACEPRFVAASLFADDRGWSIMNQFQGVLSPQGQVNYSVMYPGVIKAWHRHHKQTDFWLCLNGHLKVGVHDDETQKSWVAVIGEKRPGVVVIPPPLWHGASTVGDREAGLLYYVTHQYDPEQPDEDRRDHDTVPRFPWTVQHK